MRVMISALSMNEKIRWLIDGERVIGFCTTLKLEMCWQEDNRDVAILLWNPIAYLELSKTEQYISLLGIDTCKYTVIDALSVITSSSFYNSSLSNNVSSLCISSIFPIPLPPPVLQGNLPLIIHIVNNITAIINPALIV